MTERQIPERTFNDLGIVSQKNEIKPGKEGAVVASAPYIEKGVDRTRDGAASIPGDNPLTLQHGTRVQFKVNNYGDTTIRGEVVTKNDQGKPMAYGGDLGVWVRDLDGITKPVVRVPINRIVELG